MTAHERDAQFPDRVFLAMLQMALPTHLIPRLACNTSDATLCTPCTAWPVTTTVQCVPRRM